MARAFSESELVKIRAQLLAAGADALPRTGFRRTPIDALTRAVGISKGAFYTFFSSKEALWMAVLQDAEQTLRAELLQSVGAPGEPAEVLERTLQLLFSATNRSVMVAMHDASDLAWLTRNLPEGTLQAAQEDDDRWFAELWAQLVSRGCGDPALDPDIFAGLAPASLALAQGGHWIGAHRTQAVNDLLVSGLVLRLLPPS